MAKVFMLHTVSFVEEGVRTAAKIRQRGLLHRASV
jgi:hypothetical protein